MKLHLSMGRTRRGLHPLTGGAGLPASSRSVAAFLARLSGLPRALSPLSPSSPFSPVYARTRKREKREKAREAVRLPLPASQSVVQTRQMRISFDDLYDRSLDAVLWVYAAATVLSPLAIAWAFIFEPIFDSPKFAPRSPVATPGGKTTPQTPKAPLQTPCKTQIDPKN